MAAKLLRKENADLVDPADPAVASPIYKHIIYLMCL